MRLSVLPIATLILAGCLADREVYKCDPVSGADCPARQHDAGQLDAGIGGEDAGRSCEPSTCSGCCDGDTCIAVEQQTTALCGGESGLSCGACNGNSMCVSGSCTAGDCSVANGGCSPNASCTVGGGAPTCVCTLGYGGNGQTCVDSPPSAAGASVLDGEAADLDAQTTSTTMSATWVGFTDLIGVTGYAHNLSRSTACTGDAIATASMGTATAFNGTALSLTDGRYFNCVRATDAAGNWSRWVASNGITVDTTPPTLISSEPANLAAAIEPGSEFVLTFSEPIAAATRSPARFAISSQSQNVPFTLTWSADFRVATLTLEHAVGHGAAVSVTVTAGLADAVGNTTAAATTLRFTTRDWQWSASSVNADVLRWPLPIGIDAEGNIGVAWSGAGSSVQAKAYAPTTGWGPSSRLTSSDIQDNVDFAVNGPGSAVATWVQLRSNVYTLYAATFEPATGWSAPVRVDTATIDVCAPKVFIDDAGAATVIWEQAGELWSSRKVGSTWSLPFKLGSSADSYGSFLTGNAAGDLAVVWGSHYPYVATFKSGVWSAPVLLPPPASSSFWGADRSIAMTGDGTVVVGAVLNMPISARFFQFFSIARFEPGAGWSPWEPMTTPTEGNAEGREQAVAVDALGNVEVTWVIKADNGVFSSYGRRFTGGAWQNTELLANNSQSAGVVLDAAGNGYRTMVVLNLGLGLNELVVRPFSIQSGWGASKVVLDDVTFVGKMVRNAAGHTAFPYSRGGTIGVAIFN